MNDFTDFTSGEMVAMIADHYPDTIMAHYTSAWDHNQIFFYWAMLNLNYVNILLYGVDYGADVDSTAVEWNQRMYGVMDDALASSTEGNIRYYVSPGCNHTILGNPKLYTEETNGYTVAGWINQMVDTGLTGLDNVACSDCDTKPDYPSMWESCD